MQTFIMHVGHKNIIDIEDTIKRKRTINEILEKLPIDAPEREYFEKDIVDAFPTGSFNCWGIPPAADPAFRKTRIGDLVLFLPWIGLHNGGIHQIGIIKKKIPIACWVATKILWPRTPEGRLFPHIFFFDTEFGFRYWYDFLDDLGLNHNWNPFGWYRPIANHRFQHWGGTEGYLRFLREECGFK